MTLQDVYEELLALDENPTDESDVSETTAAYLDAAECELERDGEDWELLEDVIARAIRTVENEIDASAH